MKLLIIHQNFPGQFCHIARYANDSPDFQVLAICRDTAPGMPGVQMLRYKPTRVAGEKTHPYLKHYENAVLHGQQVLRIARKLKAQGYQPDVILAHPGWGETLFIKDVFPMAPLIHFCEYYYHQQGADCDFDPEFPSNLDSAARVRAANALHLLNLEQCDVGVTPTHWQHSLHPKAYRAKIEVIHEGVDCENIRPDLSASISLPSGELLKSGDKIVTYVARNLEPYRGFHSFMRSVPSILEMNADVKVLIVGGDGVSYGRAPYGYPTWREKMMAETGINDDRVVFMGRLSKEFYIKILQVSRVHIHLTYPFVLSWSALEAMAAGCQLVASNTAPVREVVKDNKNGKLVDFFDFSKISQMTSELLAEPVTSEKISARSTACRYSIDQGVHSYLSLFDRVGK